jgi:hypothetical protein
MFHIRSDMSGTASERRQPSERHRPSYRLIVFDKPRGPWRADRATVLQDAIDAGLAAYDRSRREHFIAVPADVEMRSPRRR